MRRTPEMRLASERRSTPRQGLSLLEIVFALAIFGVVFGLLSRNLRFATQSRNLLEKLDVLQSLRLAELRLRGEISTGTGILLPREGAPDPTAALVWVGERNELRMLYLDDHGRLKILTRGGDTVTLCEGVTGLEVRQPVRGAAECSVTVDSPDHGQVSVVFAGFVGNHFLGEGRAP